MRFQSLRNVWRGFSATGIKENTFRQGFLQMEVTLVYRFVFEINCVSTAFRVLSKKNHQPPFWIKKGLYVGLHCLYAGAFHALSSEHLRRDDKRKELMIKQRGQHWKNVLSACCCPLSRHLQQLVGSGCPHDRSSWGLVLLRALIPLAKQNLFPPGNGEQGWKSLISVVAFVRANPQ